jgi:hypothetical protein
VERSRSAGIFAEGGSLAFEGSVVRDTVARQIDGAGGPGIVGKDWPSPVRPSSFTIADALLDRNRADGILLYGSNATVVGTLVRGTTTLASDGTGGFGVNVQIDTATKARGKMTLSGSVFEGNVGPGVVTSDSDVVIDRCVVTSTPLSPAGTVGVLSSPTGVPGFDDPRGTLAVTRSLLDWNIGEGMYVSHTDATVSGTWIRGVSAVQPGGKFGDGVTIDGDTVLTGSQDRIEGAARAGFSMFSVSQATLGSTTLSCDTIPLDSEDQSSFTNGGGLVCSCGGTTTACHVVSSSLQPPPPIAPSAPTP